MKEIKCCAETKLRNEGDQEIYHEKMQCGDQEIYHKKMQCGDQEIYHKKMQCKEDLLLDNLLF
jgi:hypothetical protein